MADAASIVASFPVKHVPKITGQPTFQTLQPLKTALCHNARSVASLQGGGNRGHLGLVMPAAQYNALPGAVPWVNPVNPPILPDFAGAGDANARQRILERHHRDRQEFTTFQAVDNGLKEIIMNTVDDIYIKELSDPDLGYAEVTVGDILAHLLNTYGDVTDSDLLANQTKLTDPWDPTKNISVLWARITDCQRFQTQHGTAPFSEAETIIPRIIQVIEKSGIMYQDLRRWKLLPVAQRNTVQLMKDFWNEAYKNHQKELTARQAGFHAITGDAPNQPSLARILEGITMLQTSVDTLALTQQANAAGTTTRTAGTPPRATTPTANNGCLCIVQNDGSQLKFGYCWTHGFTLNADHTSLTCNRRAEGHKEDATMWDRKGGKSTISFRTRPASR